MSVIEPTKRWDPIVKLTHWGVASAVIANALFTEEGSGWHVWVGYALAGLLLLRWLWGFVGTRNARFSAFPPNPMRAVRYIAGARKGQVQQHSSHNPLGTLMVYALWSCLAVIIASGIAMSGPPPANPNVREAGEAYEAASSEVRGYSEEEGEQEREEQERGESGEGGEEVLEEVHEVAVNLLYVLIALHILGVLFETMRHGRGTVGAMIPFMNRRKP